MTPEKKHLLRELLDEQQDSRREATFLAAGRILRRRRWRRAAVHGSIVIVTAILALVSLRPLAPSRARMAALPSALPADSAEPAIQSISDAQLLTIFSDTPVGLATLADGSKHLIFPRPGDEERFVNRN